MAYILNAIFAALAERGSAYASVLGALLDLVEKGAAVALAKAPAESFRRQLGRAARLRRLLDRGPGPARRGAAVHVVRNPHATTPFRERARMNALQSYLNSFFFTVYPYPASQCS